MCMEKEEYFIIIISKHLSKSFSPKSYIVFVFVLELTIRISKDIFERVPCDCFLVGSAANPKRYSAILHIQDGYVPCSGGNRQVFVGVVE